jgi:hypothetical protein
MLFILPLHAVAYKHFLLAAQPLADSGLGGDGGDGGHTRGLDHATGMQQ